MASTDFCKRTGTIAGLMATAVLAGCSVAGPRSSPLPNDGPTLVQVYRDHIATEGAAGQSPRERLPLRGVDDDTLPAQRRTDMSPVQQRFQRLPNADLVMHVFPHLARGRYPVPGYVTVFPMYDTVEYAMPGEAFERASRQGMNGRVASVAPTASVTSVTPAASTPQMSANKTPSMRAVDCQGEAGCSHN